MVQFLNMGLVCWFDLLLVPNLCLAVEYRLSKGIWVLTLILFIVPLPDQLTFLVPTQLLEKTEVHSPVLVKAPFFYHFDLANFYHSFHRGPCLPLLGAFIKALA